MANITAAPSVVFPHFTPVEAPAFAYKRAKARRALNFLPLPTDKKYTNWERLKLLDSFAELEIGGMAPQLTIDQPDYDTGIKTIAIPLSKATKDWPEHVDPYLMGSVLPPDGHYFSALSGAFYTEGAVVVVPPNTSVDVVADFSAVSGKLNAYRTIIIVNEGASATYTEISTDRATDSTVVSHGVEVYLKANALLDFYALQQWSKQVSNFSVYRASLERDAKLNWLLGSFGSGLTQLHVESALEGEGAETNVRTVYYGTGSQHIDQQLVANHVTGHTSSNTYARGIVEDNAKAIYRGMIQIQRGAHGSSADQNGHALVLSDDAHADAIPGLEIDADDVTAGHGATIGQIDAEQLFYLMARGLSREAATQLVIRGFFEDLFKRIELPEVRQQFWSAVELKEAS